MDNLKQKALFALEILRSLGADEAQVSTSDGMLEEFNMDAGEFTLIRSAYSQSIGMKVIKDRKKGTAAVNSLEEDEIRALAAECMAAAESGAPDDAFTVADKEENRDFVSGALKPQKEVFFDSLLRYAADIGREFPEIMLEQMSGAYSFGRHVVANTKGVLLSETDGEYGVNLTYSAQTEEKTASFNYFGFSTLDPAADFMELGMSRTMFSRAVAELDASPFEGKFTGTAVFAPGSIDEAVGVITGPFAGGIAVMEGTSPWKDSLGKQVASDCFTLREIPYDDRIVNGERITGDGYCSANYDIIKNGVLEAFCMGDYTARKTGHKRAPAGGGNIEIVAGDKPLEQCLKNVKKGVLVCRFSGGSPAANGDFSGVAKNSFLIEDGKITRALSETMISGNFADMLRKVEWISAETLNDGSCILPYVAFGGVTVSGGTVDEAEEESFEK